MIIYFSGTGNSLAISQQIAEATGDNVMSLGEAVKTNFTSEQTIGLVYPSYDFNAPKAVRRLLPRLKINPHAYVFVIITCGAQAGLSSHWAVRMFKKQGIQVAYTHKIRVPDCSALAFGRNPNEQTWKFDKYASRLQQIIIDIQQQKHAHHYSGWSIGGWLMQMPKLDAWAYKQLLPHVNAEKCIGCGTCEKVCPIGNIVLVERPLSLKDEKQKPLAVVGADCTNCLSCVHFCPHQALELSGKLTQKDHQYHHPKIRLKDILQARKSGNQTSEAQTTPSVSSKTASKRYTPERITRLQENEIFVFGSNLEGMHGGGAARYAYEHFGAVWGQGVGLHGQTYAIPTMQGGVETIQPYVDEFIRFAKAHEELTFLVTRIGCGIAGFTNKQIAPLFYHAIDAENIILPKEFDDIVQDIHNRFIESFDHDADRSYDRSF